MRHKLLRKLRNNFRTDFTKVTHYLVKAQVGDLSLNLWRNLRHVFGWRKSLLLVVNMALMLLAQRKNKRAIRREKLFRDRTNPLDNLDDKENRGRYRFSREGIFRIVEDLRDSLERHTRVILCCVIQYYKTQHT